MHYQPTDDQIAYLKELGVPAFADRPVHTRSVTKTRSPAPIKSRSTTTGHRPCRHDSTTMKGSPSPVEWKRVATHAEDVVGKILTPKPPRRIVLNLPVWLQRAWTRFRRMLGTWIVLVSVSLLANRQLAAVTTSVPQSCPGTNAVVMQPSATGSTVRTNHGFVDTLTLPTEPLTFQRTQELLTAHERRLDTLSVNLNTNLLAIAATQRMIQNALESTEDSLADLTEWNCMIEMRQWQLEQNAHLNNERLCRIERTLWIAIGIIGLTVVWGFWHTESHLRHAEQLFVQERRVDANTSEETRGTSRTTLTEPQGSHTTQSPSCPIGSQHSAIHDEVPSPQELLRRITAAAKRNSTIRYMPIAPVTASWGIGLSSSKGPVRDRNEDYALTFEINEHQVILIADGVGGMPHGQQAAYYAVRAAAWQIVQSLGRQQTPSSTITWDTLAADAVQHAARSLRIIVRRHSEAFTTGFRTTLLVIVASRTHYYFCYLGDGGGCVRRVDGTCVRFLVPQKADPDMPNILAGSLGPITQGAPVCGTLSRLPGDLLVCGTDGVMDRLGDDFATQIWEAAVKMEGKLQCITDRLVEQMSSARDEHGYICDDNLTIALMGDGVLDGKATVSNNTALASSHHLSLTHIREGLVTACSVLLRVAPRLWESSGRQHPRGHIDAARRLAS